MNEPEYKINITMYCSECGGELAFEAHDPIGTDAWSSIQMSVKACEKCKESTAGIPKRRTKK